MKELKCSICGKYLGEMEKGKIHLNASILCEKCMKSYETYKSLADYKKTTDNGDNSFNDVFSDFFKGGK